MFALHYLSTGSKGNCCLVETDKVKFLIDIGINPKHFKTSIKKFSSITSIDFALITHEHGDHIMGAKKIIDKYKIPCYLSQGTFDNSDLKNLNRYLVNIVKPNKKYKIEDLTILPFVIDHDAEEPLGFLIKNKEGEKLLFVADCGNFDFVVDADIYAIELNYMQSELEKLIGTDKEFLYDRTGGIYGHIELEQAIDFAKENIEKEYIFHHMSKTNFNLREAKKRLDEEGIKYTFAKSRMSFEFKSSQRGEVNENRTRNKERN